MSFSFSAAGETRAAFVDTLNEAAANAIRAVDEQPGPQLDDPANAAEHAVAAAAWSEAQNLLKRTIREATELAQDLAASEVADRAVSASVSGHVDASTRQVSVSYSAKAAAPATEETAPPQETASVGDTAGAGQGKAPDAATEPTGGAGAPTAPQGAEKA